MKRNWSVREVRSLCAVEKWMKDEIKTQCKMVKCPVL